MTDLDDQNSQIDTQLIQDLLALSSVERQLIFLRKTNLAHPEGLVSLLERAAELVRRNPTQARQLASICADVARQLAVKEAIPRAAYIKAQTYALAGEFDQALQLIQEARDAYTALGQEIPAMRTTAGLMHVLGESGRYQEAIEAGRRVLDKIGRSDEPALTMLAAHIQQNMGLCYNYIGRYEEALDAYNAAEAHYLSLGMNHQVGDISNNRGILLWEMGRGAEALAALENALAIRAAAGLTMLHAQSQGNVGSAHLLLGNYTASLDAFEKARRLFDSLEALVDQHVLLFDTAHAYLTLNLYPEALAAYREASDLLRAAGASHHRARALWGLGATLLAQKQLDEAEKVLAEAVATLEKAAADGPTPLLATILMEQAAVQAARQKQAAALATTENALALAADREWAVPAIYAHLQLADLKHEDPAAVEAHLAAAQHLVKQLGLPHLRYRLHQRLGRLRQLQGRDQEARELLETAVAEIEHLRGNLAQETIRTYFLHDKAAAYDALVQLYLAGNDAQDVQRAFTVAEKAKSRTLLDVISGVLKPSTPAAEPTAVQLQEMQASLNAVYNEMLNPVEVENPAERYRKIQAQAAGLERAINQLRLRAAPTDPVLDEWPEAPFLPALQAQLPAQLTLLSYYIVGDEILAFIIRKHATYVVRQVGQASQVQQLVRRLDGQLDRLRAGLSFTADHVALLELSTRRVLAELYQALVAPLEEALGRAETTAASVAQPLVVIPHGPLHQVPFHALFDGDGYLIERFEISYAPSAAVYLHCQQRAPGPVHKAAVFGVPDPAIPAVAEEVALVSRQLPSAAVFLDEQAVLRTLQTETAACQLLHMACHGLFRADNPMFSALKLHDGWLTAVDAMQFNLADALVTLSACESGRSTVAGGDELIGLPRAFLSAGAATVIVSHWLVQDQTTAALMADLYAHIQTRDAGPAAALRAAQLTLKEVYPHPYYWASFISVGRR